MVGPCRSQEVRLQQLLQQACVTKALINHSSSRMSTC
jgi:hypothetical protein